MTDSIPLCSTAMRKKSATIHLWPVLSFIVAALVALIFMIDPTRTGWGSSQIPWLRYLPIELSAVAVGLDLVRKQRQKFTWPEYFLMILFLWMLGGSVYTIVVHGNPPMHSWLGRALNIIPLWAAYRIFGQRKILASVVRRLGGMLLVAFFIMMNITILYVTRMAWRDLSQVYHAEAVFILATGVVFALAARRGKGLWWGMLVLAAGSLIGVGKFTTYVLLGTSGGLSILLWLGRLRYSKTRELDKLVVIGFRVLIGGLVLVTLFVLTQEITRARLNARAVTVREQTFEQRFVQWRQHPLVGTFFVGDPITTIGPLVIPSHSDWLDILAFGGVSALLLLVLPMGYLVWKTLQIVSGQPRVSFWASWMPLFSMYYIVLFSVAMIANPMLGIPYLGFWFWLSLGYLNMYVKGAGR